MKKKTVDMIALFLTGVVCLLIIINKNDSKEEVKANGREKHEKLHDLTDFSRTETLQPSSSRCELNMSAYNLTEFSALPDHIKDFLLYQNCKSFPMLLDVPNKCGGAHRSADVFLLLVIKSSPENYDRREVLRKTWAEERLHKGVCIRRVFIIGTTRSGFEKRRLNRLLKLENNENKDILQWDFNDSFFNLTLKQILFLEWMDRRCPHARFLLNGDDDIFANTFNMIEYLQGQENNDGSRHLFTGHLIQNVGPIRNPSSKYYVPVQIQESERYPPYCGGGGFLLSGFTARTIYNMSHSVILLPIDDVYMGMCLEKAGLKPTSHFGVRTAGLNVPAENVDKFDPCYYREIILVHRFLPHMIFVMWNEIQNPDLQCGKINVNRTKEQGV
ncbi:N-acetyllactosaminide beta-1,3-N-acetylglucosaminyltransferase 3.4 [Danio aesculapii]|uniref:N-acetyllactosaminide beta-1,3-N-acetylglucosaminyltransferase 3.4 n=1 Tax=Danio aesculapii TaxID=1142201 RepID=UPI0024C0E764|nr:N-acetyllactosaminide beta-1,3-N-acetylglucosaminyltransferase 3.4 [Danio aesculapii]XP_056319933.1 N-acetyllactosaminide beta-1,3-N-acetylglucosaminyltransferase 3.4 [Danio aesculapii]XP_056319934.1 N-acetyllactosaminide beta-1,3-N-acetylglucosaminyltransferase 3.4 [Danio aesculapii]XP_056319935.1 N-acetyllactosaminide beta-1,3-N-acetylglucosaminyltransferase 3.4 [Danio aesculapii]